MPSDNMKGAVIFWLGDLEVLPTTTSEAAVKKTIWVLKELVNTGNAGRSPTVARRR